MITRKSFLVVAAAVMLSGSAALGAGPGAEDIMMMFDVEASS